MAFAHAFEHPPAVAGRQDLVRPPRFAVVPQIDVWLKRATAEQREHLYPFAARANSMRELEQLHHQPDVTHVVVLFTVCGRGERVKVCDLLENKLLVVFGVYSPGMAELARARLLSTVVIMRTGAVAMSERDRELLRTLRARQADSLDSDLCEPEPSAPLTPAAPLLMHLAAIGCVTTGCDCTKARKVRIADGWLVQDQLVPVLCGLCGHIAGGQACPACGCGVCFNHAALGACGCVAGAIVPFQRDTLVGGHMTIAEPLWQTPTALAYTAASGTDVACADDGWRRNTTSASAACSQLVIVFVPVRTLVLARSLLRMPGFVPLFRSGVAGDTAFIASVVSGRRLTLPFQCDLPQLRLCVYLQTLRTLCLICEAQLAARLAIVDLSLDDFVVQRWADGTIQVRFHCACSQFLALPAVAPNCMRVSFDRVVARLAGAIAADAPSMTGQLAALVTQTAYENGCLCAALGGAPFLATSHEPDDAQESDLWRARQVVQTQLQTLMCRIADVLNAPMPHGITAGAWAADFVCRPALFPWAKT